MNLDDTDLTMKRLALSAWLVSRELARDRKSTNHEICYLTLWIFVVSGSLITNMLAARGLHSLSTVICKATK